MCQTYLSGSSLSACLHYHLPYLSFIVLQLHNLIYRLMMKEFQLFGKQPADIKNLIGQLCIKYVHVIKVVQIYKTLAFTSLSLMRFHRYMHKSVCVCTLASRGQSAWLPGRPYKLDFIHSCLFPTLCMFQLPVYSGIPLSNSVCGSC